MNTLPLLYSLINFFLVNTREVTPYNYSEEFTRKISSTDDTFTVQQGYYVTCGVITNLRYSRHNTKKSKSY